MTSLSISPQAGQTLVDAIVSAISQAIDAGHWRPGTRIPSIRRFATDNGVSPFTVVEAYDRLLSQGYLRSRPGSGFYVEARQRASSLRQAARLEDLPIDEHWLLRNVYEHSEQALQAGCGWLPPAWYDIVAQQKALRALARHGDMNLRYGDPKGYPVLRRQLAQQLAEKGVPVQGDDILLTQGASKALDMVACALLRPGDTILVDDPGYCNLMSCLAFRGFNLVGVPWTEQGPDIPALQTLLETHRPRAFFTNPWLQNPTGASYSVQTAHQVLKLAEQYDLLLVEDNVSGDFTHGRQPTLAALDGLRRVIYIDSFSKTLSPGLRVGFIACPADSVEKLLRYKMMSGLTTPELNERVVLEMLNEGRYRRQVEKLRSRLAEAQFLAAERLHALGWELFTRPANGLFLCARPPHTIDSMQLAEQALKQDILLAPGHLFRPYGEASNWLRFNVAYSQDERLWRFLQDHTRARAGQQC
ncbi:PLP-dependent aminotransferase family protein [Aquitalea aquatica]|uniref:Putative 8-amino-7-oxononanoate synthase n=1 Tax=Aquitalea aquatica TaxID=3044273 RepID=A0A838YBS9_9NEIS|nr:PLP-dependent aminotransferase family protein [Aquitalea magnusonii]MBA4709989.1 PLP-dependent aminotransferase family protein [Aquitalea magnusonii]